MTSNDIENLLNEKGIEVLPPYLNVLKACENVDGRLFNQIGIDGQHSNELEILVDAIIRIANSDSTSKTKLRFARLPFSQETIDRIPIRELSPDNIRRLDVCFGMYD